MINRIMNPPTGGLNVEVNFRRSTFIIQYSLFIIVLNLITLKIRITKGKRKYRSPFEIITIVFNLRGLRNLEGLLLL
jgi:hypothetical protein